MLTPEESFKNLPLIMVIAFVGLRIIAIPIGIAVAIAVRRISPSVTTVVIMIFAGYIVGFVVLFVLLRQAFALFWYDAAAISLVVVAGIVFYLSYLVKRSLYARAAELKDDQAFKIFDEPVKGSRKKNRRKHY